MPFIEAPTTFYMGRRYDPMTRRLVDDVVYYDSRDLTTHAVVVGMTGSGKTGLCVTLLEEAILDNIPAIIIDPKGDITNLLLTFPDLKAQDFLPWVNVDEARRAGLEVDEYAADVADRWRDGLQAWSIVPDRVKWLKYAADYNIYTPGSEAGLPVSILDAMQAPPEGWIGHEEAHRERISGMVTALLALIGKQVEPVKDKEHVLISNIFEYAWRQGQGLTLEDVIVQVQQPPFEKLGVFDVDTFFPEKDRFKLAMELNNIIAAPSFQSWISGAPLDVNRLLFRSDGRPRVSIFYIAHLNEAERQFIITLLLENVLAWMRTLSGTTSLRALLYIDEVFGMFPPYPRNPPTKDPMLKLLKQARAFGLGLVLATQNPGDLDYKGLSNAGTWFIGKLQTENDKKKVLTGLEALANAQSGLDLGDVDDMISQLDPRVFLMHNVHDEGGPTLLHTRWAMSYLRGPLTRQQVNMLMSEKRALLRRRVVPAPGMGGYQPGPGDTGPTGPIPTPLAEPPVPRGATPPPTTLPEALPPTGSTPQPTTLPEAPAYDTPAFGTGTTPPPPRYAPYEAAPAANDSGFFPQGAQTGVGYPQRTGYEVPPPAAPATGYTPTSTSQAMGSNLPSGYSATPPVISSSVVQCFLPTAIPQRTAIANWERQYGFAAQSFGGAILVYKPILMAQAAVRYMDRKTNTNTVRQHAYHVSNVPKVGFVQWEQYVAAPIDVRSIAHEPFDRAAYGELTAGLSDSSRLKQLEKEVVDQLYHAAHLTVLYSPTLKIYSNPDASRREFRVQLQALAREQRDQEVDKVTQQYAKTLDRLEEKLRREAMELDADRQELTDRKREQLFTAGEAALSLFKGRTSYTLSRYSRAQRYSRQTRADVSQSEREIEMLEDNIDRTMQEMERALQAVNDKWASVAAEGEEQRITPYKKDIVLELFGIGWLPFWYAVINGQPILLPAHPVAAQGSGQAG
ncbi:MAG: DUF87 domain-containing protein [Anaerolineae bacterium]|nr:DUF87 domain-containing protein [Anaerolineae bacterium]